MAGRWSKEEIATFSKLWDTFIPLDEICRKLNRTPDAVKSKRYELNWQRHNKSDYQKKEFNYTPWSDKDVKVLLKEWEKGTSVRSIAKLIHKSEAAVAKKRNRMVLPVRNRPRGNFFPYEHMEYIASAAEEAGIPIRDYLAQLILRDKARAERGNRK